MTSSEAQSAAIGSPRSRMSSSWARIIAVRTPRRRCVGSTPTTVTPPQRTVPPGTVSSKGNAPAPPTIRSPSNAACIRSSGRFAREALRRLLVRRPAAEVVADRADGAPELLQVPRRPDVPGHSEHLRAVGRQIGAEQERRGLDGALDAARRPGPRGRGDGSRSRPGRRRRDRRRRARGRPCPRCGRRRRRRGSDPAFQGQSSSVTSSTTDCAGPVGARLQRRVEVDEPQPEPVADPEAERARVADEQRQRRARVEAVGRRPCTVRSISCR